MSQFGKEWNRLKQQSDRGKGLKLGLRPLPAWAQISAGSASQIGLEGSSHKRKLKFGKGKVLSGTNEIIARQSARYL